MSPTVVLTHAAASWFLAGLIWTIQVVHYPLFAAVGDERLTTTNWLRTGAWSVHAVLVVPLLLATLGRGR